MIMTLDNLNRIEQMRDFLAGTQAVVFTVATSKEGRYRCIESVLRRVGYAELKRQDKGIMMRFLMKITGYSHAQLKRLIQRYCQTGQLKCKQKTVNAGQDRLNTPLQLS